MKKLISTIVIIILFSSCTAYHSGYLNNSASLNTNNFIYIKHNAQGTANITYVFGIGGFKKMTLVNLALQDLLKNNPLLENQAYVNTAVNWRNKVTLFGWKQSCTITASIVEFNSGSKPQD